MNLGIVLLWFIVFLSIFLGGNPHSVAALSPQAAIAWRGAEIAAVVLGVIVGLIFTVKIIRNN